MAANENNNMMIRRHQRKESHTKRINANDMMVEIMQIDLPDEVLRHMSTFLFYDIRSNEYHEKQQADYYKYKLWMIVKHVFEDEFYHFRCRVNPVICHVCGNYVFKLYIKIVCSCNIFILKT